MPLYDYACENKHTVEHLRRYEARDDVDECATCGKPMKRLPPRTHCSPDGIYSYAPNIGDANKFEARHEALRKQRLDTGRQAVLRDVEPPKT